MSTKAAENLRHPPGLKFRPDDDELIEFFLLPRVRGEPAWFPGVVIIEDDSAANTLPWKLLNRHALDDDNDAYFFVHTNDVEEAARQDRYCAGGGRWVLQKPVPDGSCIGGERIEWRRVNLNLHMGRGKSGSTGWVMHEYTLTEPPCPFLKICHVSFSGHGKGRKRVPDGDESDCQASKRARVDAAAAANSGSSTCAYGSTAPAIDQGYGAEHGSGDLFRQPTAQETVDPTYLTTISDQAASAYHQQEYYSPPLPMDQGISATGHHQQMVMMPLPNDKDNCQAGDPCSATCAYGSTTTVADQDSAQEPAQATDEETLEWLRLCANNLLSDAEPTTEQQCGGDQQEQQEFWSSIGVYTENIAF